MRRLQPRGRGVRNLIHTKQKPFPQVPEKTEGAGRNLELQTKPLEVVTRCGQRLLEPLGGVFSAEDPGLWFHKAVIHPWNGMNEMVVPVPHSASISL